MVPFRTPRPTVCLPVLCFLTVATMLTGFPLRAEETVPAGRQVFSFSIDPRESIRVWEIRFDLTDQEVHSGVCFIGRDVFTSDSLEMVRESLTRTRYSITLRLRRGFMATGNGRLYLELFKGTPGEARLLPPPGAPRLATAPYSFPFSCEHDGTHVAVTVFKRSAGAPLWEGVFHEHCLWEIPTDPLVIGGRYLLMASQCGSTARYSAPALLGFRVEATGRPCSTCHGVGWLGALPPAPPDRLRTLAGKDPAGRPLTNRLGGLPAPGWPGTRAGKPVRPRPGGREYSEICPYCRGSGVRLFPFAVPEPALPNASD